MRDGRPRHERRADPLAARSRVRPSGNGRGVRRHGGASGAESGRGERAHRAALLQRRTHSHQRPHREGHDLRAHPFTPAQRHLPRRHRGHRHAVRHNLETFAESGAPMAIYAVGGGVRNPLWMQAVSDISQVSQDVRRHTTGAALGSAFLAGVGTGMFEPGDIETINPVARGVTPRSETQPPLRSRPRDLSQALSRHAGLDGRTLDGSGLNHCISF